MYLRKNSDYFSISDRLVGFYNRDRECLLRGTNWVFKLDGYSFIHTGLKYSYCMLTYTSLKFLIHN